MPSKDVTPVSKESQTRRRAPRGTRSEEAARSAVAKVVRPGEASSKKKAADNAAKAAANKAAVDKINADRAGVEDAASKAVAKAAQTAKAAPAKATTKRAAEPVAPLVPALASNRIDRINLAKSEAKSLAAWEKIGGVGDRPLTPNLDSINDGKPIPASPAAGGGSGLGRSSSKGPRGQEAAALKKATNDKRGPGKKISDEELVDYIVKARTEHPDSTSADERQYAYWIAKLALAGNGRWDDAWKKATKRLASGESARKAS